jgi:hypothetical protein
MDVPRVSVCFEAITPPLRIRIDDLTGTVLAKVLQDHLRDVRSLFSPRLHKFFRLLVSNAEQNDETASFCTGSRARLRVKEDLWSLDGRRRVNYGVCKVDNCFDGRRASSAFIWDKTPWDFGIFEFPRSICELIRRHERAE